MIKGFSLVELLVVMAIIAVLTGLAVFGIGQLNKNSRDTQRVAMLGQMVDELNDYKKENLNYPTTSEVTIANNFRIDGDLLITLTAPLIAGVSSTASRTKYEYSNEGTGQFGLCAVLESGEVKNVGLVEIDCL